jgi:uncharacterized membrane protein
LEQCRELRCFSNSKSSTTLRGLVNVVLKIGELLKTHFPYEAGTDKNELPDDIVFGR